MVVLSFLLGDFGSTQTKLGKTKLWLGDGTQTRVGAELDNKGKIIYDINTTGKHGVPRETRVLCFYCEP